MIASTLTDIDLIEELQHRRWAREHYVPAAERDRSWHPVVLDEMRRKDHELREVRIDAHLAPAAPHAFVPAFVAAPSTA
jgi:hypothetical protein